MTLPIPRPGGDSSDRNDPVAEKINYMSVVTFQAYLTSRSILLNTNRLVKQMDELLTFFRDGALRGSQDQEQEQLAKPVEQGPSIGGAAIEAVKLSVLSTAVVALGTLITMLSDEVRKTVEQAVAYIVVARKKTLELIVKMPEELLKVATALAYRVGQVIGLFIRVFEEPIKAIIKATQVIAGTTVFQTLYRSLSTMVEIAGKVVGFVSKIVGTVLRPVVRLLEGAGKLGLDLLGILGRTIGKVFLPLQVLLSAIDFIDGFIDGYRRSGIAEGIKQGLVAVFDGLFTAVVEIATNVVAWILDKIGLKNLAASLTQNVERLTADIRNVFASVVDLFIGVFTLDGAKIWESLKTGFTSFGEFFLHAVGAGINLVVNFFKDIFGSGLTEPFDLLKTETIDRLVSAISSFGDAIVEWMKDLARSTIEYLPGGEKLADKIFGERTVTEDDVEKRADEIAKQRAIDGANVNDKQNFIRRGIVPRYEVTPDDRAKASAELVKPGVEVQPSIRQDNDELFKKIEKFLDAKEPSRGASTTINDNSTNITGGRSGGSAPVVVLSRTDKASSANPVRRAGP